MWCYIFLLYFYIAAVASNDEYQTQRTNTLVLNNFIEKLRLEKWDKEERPCLEKTLALLENVKNSTLWATWIWNANTLPTGNLYGSSAVLGNYDQCMKPPWLVTHPEFATKYCLAKFLLADRPITVQDFDPYGSTDDYVNTKTPTGLPTNRLTWGLCIPAACNPPSVIKIVRAMYENTNFGTIRPNITVDYCQVAGERTQYTTGFYLFMALITSLIITAVASTFYKNSDRLKIICSCFCMKQNYRNLIKENDREIRVINGMRFITAFTVVILHELFIMLITGVSNMRDFATDIAGIPGIFLHLDIVVDTFFAMSGLLHIKGLLNAGNNQNLFMVLWKRYIRLIGPFALSIFYHTSVSEYIGTGPMWHLSNDVESKVCKKTWKLSLLMLNSNNRDICHGVTWYLSADYQLTILATVLFCFYRKDRRLGLVAFGTAAIFALIIPGFLNYWYQLPAINFLDISKFLYNVRDYWEIGYTYTSSYSRAGAYLVGVAMGYIMSIYEPAQYRKTVSKTWSILGTAASLVVMVYMLVLGIIYVGREFFPLESAVTAATNRVAWAIAVCCIIGLCEYGTVPGVTDILSSSIFTPLSRLSYSLYIIHTLVIERNKFTLRLPLKYDKFSIFTDAVGTATVSLGLSFLMWLLVEAPMINLCNQLFFAKQKDKTNAAEKNGHIYQNGKSKTKEL